MYEILKEYTLNIIYLEFIKVLEIIFSSYFLYPNSFQILSTAISTQLHVIFLL